MPRLVRLLVSALLLLGLPSPAASADVAKGGALGQIASRGVLVVGMEMKYWPFEYADAQGAPMGYDVDIARLMAQELGVRIEFKDMEWTGLIPALQAGKVDLIISGMTARLVFGGSLMNPEKYNAGASGFMAKIAPTADHAWLRYQERPSQFLTMLPYIATIVVLALISRNPTWIRVNMPDRKSVV